MQTGNVVSAASQFVSQAGVPSNNWIVDFTYQLDAGGIGTAQVRVGSGPGANVGFWASPNSTISVTAAGYTGNILLACPPLIQWAAFAQQIKGFPIA